MAYIVADSDAQVLFASAKLADLAGRLPPNWPIPAPAYVAFRGAVDGYGFLRRLLSATGDSTQTAWIGRVYSSGTTGRPKGIKPALLPIQVDQPGDPITGLIQHVFRPANPTSTCHPLDVPRGAPEMEQGPFTHSAARWW